LHFGISISKLHILFCPELHTRISRTARFARNCTLKIPGLFVLTGSRYSDARGNRPAGQARCQDSEAAWGQENDRAEDVRLRIHPENAGTG